MHILSDRCHHRRRSVWTSGGTHGVCRRWVCVEWGGIWGRVSPLQPTKGSEGASWAPPAGSGAESRPKTQFWCILKATERSFLYLYDEIWGGGQFVLASPRSKFWGLSPPVIYAHGCHPTTVWLSMLILNTGFACWRCCEISLSWTL